MNEEDVEEEDNYHLNSVGHSSVSKEQLHLFEEQNVIDVGIVNDDSSLPQSNSSSSHISSPGRLLQRNRRRRSNTSSPPSIGELSIEVNNEETIDDEDISDADEMSIATTVSSLSSESLHGAEKDNNEIISQNPELKFEMSDSQEFAIEISDWFVMNDLSKLERVKQIFTVSTRIDNFNDLIHGEKKVIVSTLSKELIENLLQHKHDEILRILICLNYLVMGCFDEITDKEDQRTKMYENITLMISCENLYKTLIETVSLIHEEILHHRPNTSNSSLLEMSTLSFYAMTILYFTFCFVLDEVSESYLPEQIKQGFVTTINKNHLLRDLVKLVDSWRWLSSDPQHFQSKSKQALKIRNVIILISKLILLEFGSSHHMKSTKAFLQLRYNSGTEGQPEYSVSPLDYHLYKEDLKMRYPSFVPPDSSLSKKVETILEDVSVLAERSTPVTAMNKGVSESLINEPFSQRRAIAQGNSVQTPPDVHIATPAPSPTLAPITFESPRQKSQYDRGPDGKDSKKIFQNTSSFPYFYPADAEAPKSVKEATDIFFHSVKEEISTKQFMKVFDDFVVQERGILNTLADNNDSKKRDFTYDESDIAEYRQYENEIVSLIRVEEFYEDSLSYFNSLVKVLLQTVESSSFSKDKSKKYNLVQEKELTREEIAKLICESDSSSLPHSLKQKYEIARVKEITLKYSSSILFNLLKWLKLSHILKFEFLSMIVFDNNFYQIYLDWVSKNFEESQIHLSNHNEFMLDNLSTPDDEILSQKFKNDKLAFIKYQFYSNFNYNKMVKSEFQIPEYNFFDKCLQLSSHPDVIQISDRLEREYELFQSQNELLKNDINRNQVPLYFANNNPIMICNWKYCFILNNLSNVLYYTINNNKIQRVNQLIEKKPTDLFKFSLGFYNKFYYRPILKIIKLIIPFNGRKWKSNNMDSISMVYLYYKVGLKDDWLTKNYNNSNLDIGEELKRSYKQEYSLRSLLQYYNIRYYGKEMENLGYEYHEMDYFNKELEILSRLYLSSQNVNAD